MSIINVGASDGCQLQTIADTLSKARKIVVVTGAGISTNSGIPDFRSENGLYSLIQAQYNAATDQKATRKTRATTTQSHSTSLSNGRATLPNKMNGRDLFDSRIWQDGQSSQVFYRFIASFRRKIRHDIERTTATHRFIKTIRDSGRLVRCYTQNIDGLESRDGLNTDLASGKGNKARFTKKVREMPRPDGSIIPGSDMDGGCEVVQLHGDLEQLRCSICQSSRHWDLEDEELMLLHGESPPCNNCLAKDQDRRGRGKRGSAVGFLRPNVVLYGEEHPYADLLSPITTHDLSSSPDVLLILGTSLQVHGLKVMVKEFAKAVHARGRAAGKVILVNNTKPAGSVWNGVIDYWIEMDCDQWVEDVKLRRPDFWLRQGELKLTDSSVAKTPARKGNAQIVEKKSFSLEDQPLLENDKENRYRVSRNKPRRPRSQNIAPLSEAPQISNQSSLQQARTGKAKEHFAIPKSNLTIGSRQKYSKVKATVSKDTGGDDDVIFVQSVPITPRKRLGSQMEPIQLLSPPESHPHSGPNRRSKRNREDFEDAENIYVTPSKRHRTFDILAQDTTGTQTSNIGVQNKSNLRSRISTKYSSHSHNDTPIEIRDCSPDPLQGIHNYGILPESRGDGKWPRFLRRGTGSHNFQAKEIIVID